MLSIALEQLAAQAVTSGTVTSYLPYQSSAYQFLSLQQLLQLFDERLDALVTAGVVSPTESAALHRRFEDVRYGRRVAQPRADRSMPPSAVTVAGILAALTPPPGDPAEESFLGDLWDFAVSAVEVAGGALLGLATGGIPGAIIGGMTVYQMQHHEEGFLTA